MPDSVARFGLASVGLIVGDRGRVNANLVLLEQHGPVGPEI